MRIAHEREQFAKLRCRSLQRHAFCILLEMMFKNGAQVSAGGILQAMSEGLANVYCLGHQPTFWAQTLDTIWMIELEYETKLCKGDVPNARMEGLMCPALVELVCEALRSIGRVPERSVSDRPYDPTPNAACVMRQHMQAPVQGPCTAHVYVPTLAYRHIAALQHS